MPLFHLITEKRRSTYECACPNDDENTPQHAHHRDASRQPNISVYQALPRTQSSGTSIQGRYSVRPQTNHERLLPHQAMLLLGVPLPQAAWSCVHRARYLHFQATFITWLPLFVHIRNRRLHLLKSFGSPNIHVQARVCVRSCP